MTTTRVLAVLSSHHELDGIPTGFWLTELAYPYHHLTRRGVQVDLASPAGGQVEFNAFSDPRNERGAEFGDLVALGLLAWEPAIKALPSTIPLAAVDPGDYATCWAVGGLGPTFDLVDNTDLRRVQAAMWESGKPLAAICHGAVSLATVTGEGESVVANQALTGYSIAEDRELEALIGRRFAPVYVEEALRAAGADYRSALPHHALVVHSANGRLLTGQNQESADEFGRALADLVAG